MTDPVPEDDALLAFTYNDAPGGTSRNTTTDNDNNDDSKNPATNDTNRNNNGNDNKNTNFNEQQPGTTATSTSAHQQEDESHHLQNIPTVASMHISSNSPPQQNRPSSPSNLIHHQQQQYPSYYQHPPPQLEPSGGNAEPSSTSSQHQPFSYVSTTASTVPVHGGNTRSRFPRRRRTGSKRSIEEAIIESSIPTSITTSFNNAPPQRQGPSIGLLTGFSGSSYSPTSNIGPTLPLNLPEPPLSNAIPSNPNSLQSDPQPRPKKKSKYSSDQDATILQMKKDGKSWSEIANAAQCGNSLAARNRYQVLIGQQGSGAVVWDSDDAMGLKNLLDDGEKAKWDYISSELSRLRSKKIGSKDCQQRIKYLFDNDPTSFGIVVGAQSTSSPYPSSAPSSTSSVTAQPPQNFPTTGSGSYYHPSQHYSTSIPPPPGPFQHQQQQSLPPYYQQPPPPPTLQQPLPPPPPPHYPHQQLPYNPQQPPQQQHPGDLDFQSQFGSLGHDFMRR